MAWLSSLLTSDLCPLPEPWRRRHLVRLVRTLPRAQAWSLVRSVWRRATVVARGPVGREGRLLLEHELAKIVSEWPDAEQLLVRGLRDENPIVAAHCALTLGLMRSDVLSALPPSVLRRREKIQQMIGCFRWTTTLGGFIESEQRGD